MKSAAAEWRALLATVALGFSPGALFAQESDGGSSIAPSDSAPPPVSTPLPSGAGVAPSTGSSALGAGVLSSGAAPAAATYNLPGGEGFVPRLVTAGEGRFAQPPWRIITSVSQGYDDNIFSTPDDPQKAEPVQTFRVENRRRFTGLYDLSNPLFPAPIFSNRAVLVKDKLIQPIEPQPRTGSATTNANVTFQAQAARPRTVYTFDLSLGSIFYWNRQEDPNDYTGSLALVYLRRINPRTTLTAQVDAVYQTQPDFSRINTPTSQTAQSYISGNARADLAYQWSPRVSSVASYALNTTLFEEGAGTDVYNNTFGGSIRYLSSPRTTFVTELRETTSTHVDLQILDSTSTFVLGGVDLTISQRIRGSLRLGEEFRSLETGESALNPYFEGNLIYLFPRGSSVEWSNRYGSEDSGAVGTNRQTYRTTLGARYVIGTRSSATLGLTYVRSSIESGGVDQVVTNTEQQIQASLGLQYLITRRWTANATFSMSRFLSTVPGLDYNRHQASIGATYSF